MKYSILLVLLIAGGCGVSNNASNQNKIVELLGSWSGSCVLQDGTGIWVVSEYIFNEDYFTIATTHYRDNTCTERYYHPNLESPSTMTGSYVRVSEINTSSSIKANLYKLTYDLSRFGRDDDIVEAGIYIKGDTLYFIASVNGSYEILFNEPWNKI